MDPDAYAIQIARVMEFGDTSAITYGFYSRAPFHILEGAMTGLTTGLPSPAASAVYPVMSGAAVPLLAAIFVGRLRPDSPRTMILAAGGASVLGYSVHFSYWPIAQTTGVLFLLFTVFSIFVFASSGDRRWLALGILTMLGAVFTHKLVAIGITLSVGGALLLGLAHPATRNTLAVKRLAGGALGIVAILTAEQLFYVTGFAQSIVFQITVPDSTGLGPATPSAAVDPYTLTHRLFRLSYVLFLAAAGGLVWLGWLWRTIRTRGPRRDVVFLGLVAPLAGLVVLLYPGGVNPVRTIFYSETLLIVLVAVGWYWTAVESPAPSRTTYAYVAMGGLLVLVATAGVSPIAGPDSEPLNRNYLTSEEVEAKEWGYERVPGEIATDQYYASETPPKRIAAFESNTDMNLEKFEDQSITYLNNTFREDRPESIAHRSCIETLRSGFGPWRLTYDADRELNMTYSRMYDSGCVSYFKDTTG